MGSRYAKAMLAILACMALTACGGGGGGGDAGIDQSTDAIPSTALSGPVNASGDDSHYVAAGNASGSGSSAPQDLLILDADTKQIVRKIKAEAWQASGRLKFDAGTRQYRYMGVGHVYYIADSKLYQLDLSNATLGEAKRITSITNACGMGGVVASAALDGRHDWLAVGTTDAKGQCTTSRLVASDMSPTEQGIDASGTNWKAILGNLPDAQGTPSGLLVMEGATGQLAVYSLDLKARRYTVANAPTLGNNEWIGRTLPAPDVPQKAYLQLADKLYLLDWQGGQLSLGSPLAQLPSATEPMLSASDSRHLYFVYKTLVYAASSDRQLRLFAEMDVQLGTARAIANVSTSIGVLQETTPAVADAIRSSLTAFDKLSGKATTLLSSSPNISPWIMASGEEMVLHQFDWDAPSPAYGHSTFLLAKLSQGGVQTLTEKVRWVGLIPSSTWSGAEMQYQTLLWDKNRSELNYSTLPSHDLQAYTFGQERLRTLGSWPADSLANAWLSISSWLPNGNIVIQSTDDGDTQFSFWQAHLGTEHSLGPVLALP